MALLAGCEAAAPPVVTPPPSTPRSIATLVAVPTQPLAVAVPVGSPTATPVVVGDYPTLVRDRLLAVESALKQLDQQFAVLKASPVRIVEPQWRDETLRRVDDIGSAADSLRALGARTGSDGLLYGEVVKLLSDLDFVVSEYRMAFDFDPDGSHLARAGRAEKMTSDEVESMLLGLHRGLRVAPTLTPTPIR